MEAITSKQCEVPRLIRNLPLPRKNRDDFRRSARSILKTINDPATRRYRLDNTIAVGMVQDDTPMPESMGQNIRWPHDGRIYVEYDQPIILDERPGQGDHNDCLNGLIIEPAGGTSVITTFGTSGYDLVYFQNVLHHDTGAVEISSKVPEEDVADELARTSRYYARLAAYMNAHVGPEER